MEDWSSHFLSKIEEYGIISWASSCDILVCNFPQIKLSENNNNKEGSLQFLWLCAQL